MLIKSFIAGPWQTNCYVVAASRGSECIVIDPGQNALSGVQDVITQDHLKPVAVLVTHGHLDHMWSVFPVAKGYEIPAFIHGSDRHLLKDPGAGLSAETRAMLPALVGNDHVFVEPDEVIQVSDQQTLDVAGMNFTIRHTPGHTAGSVIFMSHSSSSNLVEPVVFTGDTLFAGAIGRTDLPGSSPSDMNESLANVILELPESSQIFPGHGPATKMDIELKTNQYLLRITQGLSAT